MKIPLQQRVRKSNTDMLGQMPNTAFAMSGRRFDLRRQKTSPELPPRPNLPKLTNDRSRIPAEPTNRNTIGVRVRKWWSALLRRAAVAVYNHAVQTDPA